MTSAYEPTTNQTHSPLFTHTIPNLPPSFHYIPAFLIPSEESALLATFHSKPWVQLSKRRLQVYPAQLTAKNVLLSKDPLPEWLLQPLQHRFEELGIFEGLVPDGGNVQFNHVLVNNYRPGEGIMPHEDGAAYYPVTATVSLGGHCVLDVREKNGSGRWRILQEPRSLLVTRNEAYGGTLHGIQEVEVDEGLGEETVANWGMLREAGTYGGEKRREERTSLTCRSVVKVSKLGSKLLLKG